MVFSATIIRARKIISFFLALVTSMLLCGCSQGKVKRNYTESEFSAEIVWEIEGESFSALVRTGTIREERVLTMEFLSPERMRGIKAECRGEGSYLSFGDVSVELHNDPILEVMHLLADRGSFSFHGSTEIGGRELILAERICGNERSEIYIDSESGAPFRAVSGSLTLDVVWFEYLS